jgi:hypothetical protein
MSTMKVIFGKDDSLNNTSIFCGELILYIFFFYVGQQLTSFYKGRMEKKIENNESNLKTSEKLQNKFDL